MRCPKCDRGVLDRRTVHLPDVTVDQCRLCGGVWFDRGELERVIRFGAEDLALPPKAVDSGRLCPICIKPMYTFTYPQTLVEVEMCRMCCGLWLDAGEMQEIRSVRETLDRQGRLGSDSPGRALVNLLHVLVEKLCAGR